MEVRELAELLVESGESYGLAKYIPWWEEDCEEDNYRDDLFEEDVIREAEACLEECGKEELLAPAGRAGLTLFQLLVWHNFYEAVKKMLSDGRLSGEEADMPDSKGYGLTALLLACARGNLAMAELLLERGANDSACDKRGMNAWHFLAYPRLPDDTLEFDSSCLEKSVEQRGKIARLLTCDVNRRNEDGLTPLELLLSTSYCSGYTWPLTEVLLDRGARTDYVDGEGNTLLMMARRNGHQTAALRLTERCPELVNRGNNNGVTPIRHAADFGDQAMYLALKEHGADPLPEMELFPLSQITDNSFADVEDDNRDGVSLALYLTGLMIRQADPDDDDELGEIAEILHNALTADREALVLDLCREAGIDFTAPVHFRGELFCLRDKCLQAGYGMGVIKKLAQLGVDLDRAVIKGRTPACILAAQRGGEEAFFERAAEYFSGESMGQTDNFGEAAIHKAAENGHTGMLRVMLEKGVDINLTEDEPGEAGVTPLHLACLNGCADAVRLLMEAGADDGLRNLKGETPAHFALKKKSSGRQLTAAQRIEILKCLKNLDIPDEEGRTPLLALQGDEEELIPVLLERGADVNRRDNDGVTALMRNTYKDVAKLLIGAGADVNLADNEGNTALHYALRDFSEGDACYLIKKGADCNRPNNQGETPAQLAAENGLETVLELMAIL